MSSVLRRDERGLTIVILIHPWEGKLSWLMVIFVQVVVKPDFKKTERNEY